MFTFTRISYHALFSGCWLVAAGVLLRVVVFVVVVIAALAGGVCTEHNARRTRRRVCISRTTVYVLHDLCTVHIGHALIQVHCSTADGSRHHSSRNTPSSTPRAAGGLGCVVCARNPPCKLCVVLCVTLRDIVGVHVHPGMFCLIMTDPRVMPHVGLTMFRTMCNFDS